MDTADLLALLGNWGECPGRPGPWDFDGGGIVDALDLLALLAARGPCQ
jgi:hypothetical protein